jgi:hypothetical protein
MGMIFPETSVRNYHSTVCNISEEGKLHDDLAMQALIWFLMVQLSTSDVNLRWPYILKCQLSNFKGKISSCIQVNMSSMFAHQTEYIFLFSLIRSTCSAHFTLLYVFNLLIFNLLKSTNHEDPHYAVSSNLLLLPPSLPQTSSSASCSQIPLAYFLSFIWVTKFHIHIEQQAQLQ